MAKIRFCALLAATASLAGPVFAQEHAHHQHETAPPAHHEHHQPPTTAPAGHDTHDHEAPDGARMTGLFGAYSPGRDASGTSWQPDAAHHGGLHAYRGDWMLMGHAMLNAVHSWQDGPRGDEKGFLAGMVMGSARRNFATGVLNLRAMLSPDPLMGDDGYPLLLAAGETADGVAPLVDRQHPHDLFMELAASYTHPLSAAGSVFVYAGLPGEPAFGPPAFMHRPAAMDSPEAPITHHWLDSTHITFGVITAGYVYDDMKLEISRFRGREPDESRTDIEAPRDLDSTAIRASWNPTDEWALQASWADVASPEQLEPDHDETRTSLSALYTHHFETTGSISFTAAAARKDRSDGVTLDAFLLEGAYMPSEAWTIFSRAEWIETDELGAGHHGPVEDVAKASLGVIRDFRVHENAVFGIGGLVSRNWVSDALSPLYDGDQTGAMAFVRLKIG